MLMRTHTPSFLESGSYIRLTWAVSERTYTCTYIHTYKYVHKFTFSSTNVHMYVKARRAHTHTHLPIMRASSLSTNWSSSAHSVGTVRWHSFQAAVVIATPRVRIIGSSWQWHENGLGSSNVWCGNHGKWFPGNGNHGNAQTHMIHPTQPCWLSSWGAAWR